MKSVISGETHQGKNIVIVVGASGPVGQAYLEAYSKMSGYDCIGITRNETIPGLESVHCIAASVGKSDEMEIIHNELPRIIKSLQGNQSVDITLLYTPGPTDWQELPPKLDEMKKLPAEDVWKLNFVALKDVLSIVDDTACRLRRESHRPVNVRVVGLSSISLDREDSHLYPAYGLAKNAMEKHINAYAKNVKGDVKRSGLVISTATIDTPQERKIRPLASDYVKEHWLKIPQLIEETIPSIIGMETGSYKVQEVIKRLAGHTPAMHKLESAYARLAAERRDIPPSPRKIESSAGGVLFVAPESNTPAEKVILSEVPPQADATLHGLWVKQQARRQSNVSNTQRKT